MLSKKAQKKGWTGLQELYIRDDNELYKPDLISVKEEGAWDPTWVAKLFSPIPAPHPPLLLPLKPRNLPLILQHPSPSRPSLCHPLQNNHKHCFG